MYARVSLGYFLLAKHPHGYTPFLVDPTPRVKSGEELAKLTIRTDRLPAFHKTGTPARESIVASISMRAGISGSSRWDLWVETPETDLGKAHCVVTSDRKADVTVRFEDFRRGDENLAGIG